MTGIRESPPPRDETPSLEPINFFHFLTWSKVGSSNPVSAMRKRAVVWASRVRSSMITIRVAVVYSGRDPGLTAPLEEILVCFGRVEYTLLRRPAIANRGRIKEGTLSLWLHRFQVGGKRKQTEAHRHPTPGRLILSMVCGGPV